MEWRKNSTTVLNRDNREIRQEVRPQHSNDSNRSKGEKFYAGNLINFQHVSRLQLICLFSNYLLMPHLVYVPHRPLISF
jgi:hypothetical protein